jgi:hypothetical protein
MRRFNEGAEKDLQDPLSSHFSPREGLLGRRRAHDERSTLRRILTLEDFDLATLDFQEDDAPQHSMWHLIIVKMTMNR